MTHRILVVAPHPDDELLGCGGTLLRRKAEGAEIDWLILTGLSEQGGWTAEQVRKRQDEIAQVAAMVGFRRVEQLGLRPAHLDAEPRAALVQKVAAIVEACMPAEVLVPSPADVHSDHRVAFDVVSSCTKWFRHPSVRRIMAYETLSETDFALHPGAGFQPNVFVDISAHIDRKLEILGTYGSELGVHPFPRSVEAVRALAVVRGAASGFAAAEGFQLLRERG